MPPGGGAPAQASALPWQALSSLMGGALSDGLGSSDLPGLVLNRSGGDFLAFFFGSIDASTQQTVTAARQAGCRLCWPSPVARCSRAGTAGRALPPPLEQLFFIPLMPLVLRPLHFTDAQTGTCGSVAKASQGQKQFRCWVGGVTVQRVFLFRTLLGPKKVLLVTSQA